MRIGMVNPRRKSRVKHTRKHPRKAHKKSGKRRGGRSSYQSFVKRELPKLYAKGKTPKQAMTAVGAMWRGGKKSVGKKTTRRRKGRSNWGTRAGGRKGWNKREAHVKGYKRTRGARYPPKHRAPRISKAKRRRAALKGWRGRKHHKVRANPSRKRRHSRHRAKANRRRGRRAGRRRSRRNPLAFGVGAKIDRHVKPHYGNAHMKFMASCLRQRGGRHGMKACAGAWRKQAGKHGHRQPLHKRRANPGEYAMAPSHGVGGKLESFAGKLGFPSRGELFPSWEQVKAHKLGTAVGAGVGVSSAYGFGQAFRSMAGSKNAVGAEVLSTVGGIFGTELPARVWRKWGPEKAYKNTAVKSVRLFGYGTTLISTVFGLIRLATAKGELSGLGDAASKAKDFAKKVAEKAKKALGVGLFGSKKGVEDIVSSGWDQGYTGSEPLGVSGPMDELTSKLDTRIKALAKELGLSDVEVTDMMRQEGYDIGAYPSYASNPFPPQGSGMGYLDYQLSGLGQYGSPAVPLLGDSNVPPTERDIFRSDFVV